MDITQEFLSKINSTKVLVIAGSIREFKSFVDTALYKHAQEGLYEGYEFIYCSNPNSMRGLRFDKVLYYGTGSNRDDIDINDIRMLIKS